MAIPYIGAFLSSGKRHLEFVMARDFYRQEGNGPVLFQREKPLTEKIGQTLCYSVEALFHFILTQPKRRVAILVFTSLTMLIVALFFYPLPTLYASFYGALVLFGQTQNFWVFKLAVYFLMQATILGYGMRAFGRCSSDPLVQNWERRGILPLHIGSFLLA